MQAQPRPADMAQTPAATAPAATAFDGGDDLVRARSFCDTARLILNAIIDAPRECERDDGRDPHWIASRLTTLQQGAKRARARAVYRSAQDVLSLIHRQGPHMPTDWGQVDGRILVLNKLVIQYTQGLEEVEAETVVEPTAASAAQPVTTTPANDIERYAQARATLRDLLPHARSEERAALARLLDPGLLDGDSPAPRGVPLDDAMPELVQRLLGEGRDYGKTLSVSCAVECVRLPEAERDALVERLYARLSPLIASELPLQGVGHLDISEQNGVLHVSGTGFAGFEMRVAEVSAQQRITPPKKPMINPDTEDLLRAQLSALLDGTAP